MSGQNNGKLSGSATSQGFNITTITVWASQAVLLQLIKEMNLQHKLADVVYILPYGIMTSSSELSEKSPVFVMKARRG